MGIRTIDGRRDALSRVPPDWQALVRLHVELAVEKWRHETRLK